MLFNALLIIAIVQGQATTINYEKVEDMRVCEKLAQEIKEDSDTGVYVLCVPVDPTSEV